MARALRAWAINGGGQKLGPRYGMYGFKNFVWKTVPVIPRKRKPLIAKVIFVGSFTVLRSFQDTGPD